MARDVRGFVQGCSDCAISIRQIRPLPVSNRPWPHLGVDFITDLPASDGNTCVFVIIDRFSKSCRLLPLKGLPTAMETAILMFNNIVHYYGIPEDIVSDRGLQFISKVWKAFFNLLDVCRQDTTPSRTGRRRGRSWRLDASSEPSAMATRTLGTSS